MIDIQFFETKKISLKASAVWLENVISNENKKLGEIVVIICKDDYLLEKNIKFLKHDTLTDVISFDYSTDKNISGDIFISIDRIKENAKTYNVTFLKELDRVMVHGLLHLLGYNDKTEKDATEMKKKENFYLSIK
jgi:probable rRNA maturation factor